MMLWSWINGDAGHVVHITDSFKVIFSIFMLSVEGGEVHHLPNHLKIQILLLDHQG